MDIFKTKDKVLAALGNVRAMERLHVDTYTEEKIKNITGNKIAESIDGQIWVDFQELNGFLFMNSTIISKSSLKITNGAKLLLLTDEFEITIDSDEQEIDSDFSNVSNRWISQISFVLDSKEKEIIENKQFEEIEYIFKKGKLRFDITK